MSTPFFVDGFELGTTLAEANLMSGNTITITGTGSCTFGANGLGDGGRSMYPVLAGAAGSASSISVPVTIPYASANTISWGFRGVLATAYNGGAGIGGVGVGQNVATSSLTGIGLYRNATADRVLNVYNRTTLLGSITVPDNNSHYWTVVWNKIAGTTYTIQVYMDNTRMANYSGVTVTWTSTNAIFYAQAGLSSATHTEAFSEIDSVYMNDQNPLGTINARHIAGASDIQAQFTRVGSVNTNYGSSDNISLTTGNSLTATSPAEDIYGTNSSITAGNQLIAVCATVVANGASSDLITAKASSGANSISSAATALGAIDARISTGWTPLAMSGGNLNTLRYGQAKS